MMLIFKKWGKNDDGADDGVDSARYTKSDREKVWEDAKRAFLQNEKLPLGAGAIADPSTPDEYISLESVAQKNSKRLDLLEMNAEADRNPDVHLVGGYYVLVGIGRVMSMFAFHRTEYKIRKHDSTDETTFTRAMLPAVRKLIEIADEQDRMAKESEEKGDDDDGLVQPGG